MQAAQLTKSDLAAINRQCMEALHEICETPGLPEHTYYLAHNTFTSIQKYVEQRTPRSSE